MIPWSHLQFATLLVDNATVEDYNYAIFPFLPLIIIVLYFFM